MSFGKGHIPDPEAVRQRRAGFHLLKAKHMLGASPLPLATSNRQFFDPSMGGPGIQDQGSTGRCEGFAHSGAITTRFAIQRKPIARVSPTGIYTVARMISRLPNADGTLPPLTDDGTEPSLVVAGLSEWGVCSAKTWGDDPDDPSKVNDEPTPQQLEAAGEFTLLGAYFMRSSGDQFLRDLMTALAAGYPCTGAIAASSAEFEGYSGGVLGPLDDDVDHATLFLDYSWDGANLASLVVTAANSWGIGWGEAGFYRCNADFLRKYANDCAVIDVAPINGGSEI